VAPALVERVHAAVAELGYVADIGAARLRSRRSTIVGVVVPDFANPYYDQFVSVVERAAHAAGYELMLVSSNASVEIETRRLRSLMTWRPAGIILLPCDDDFTRLADMPMVVADRIPERLDVDAVGIDNRAAAFEATRHLIEQGHIRLLAVACGGMTIRNVAERCQGYLAACVDRATAAILEVGISTEECRTALVRHLSCPSERPAALFTANNTATMGALEAFNALGMRIGRDIALAAFDYEPWMSVVSPPLTAVRQPVTDVAQATWDRLQARMDGDSSVPGEIRLECRLEVRESSQPLQLNATPEAA
jgi:DNA-binding LacI/PurR family transcriptional regulator